MRSRLFLLMGFALAVIATGVLTPSGSRGQAPGAPPKELPPEVIPPTPVGTPAKGVVPAAVVVPKNRKPAPFDRFAKYDELPEQTRELVLATQRGIEWLSRDRVIHRPDGRFVPGIDPALGRFTDDDSFIRQAQGALALSRAARLTGEEKTAVRAAQTILSLLAEAPKDPEHAGTRKPMPAGANCNRLGAAAFLALAIFELPDVAPDMLLCGEELCQFIRTCLQADGSVQTVPVGDAADPTAEAAFSGPTLAALAWSHRLAPATWKVEAGTRGVAYYRKQFRATPNPNIIPWMTAAAAEIHLQTKDAAAADFVFEMADWLRKLQFDGMDRQRATWRGGFATVVDGKVVQTPPTIATASYALAFAEACRMIRQMDRPDAGRYDQYRGTLARALQFVVTLQYAEENTQHFVADFRPALVGAFHPSATDGNLRTDHTATAVAALSQFLIVGADR
ncbi:MAG TPA: hypothetical protein VHR66_25025 [Gemmataceae bacterium]|jgi:hypothetical protein|nr:hypothetical protein [Gemmataceae bacterium]